jgi:hypothetical protein
MDSANQFWVAVVTDEGPALFRVLKRVVNRLPISTLDKGFGVFKVPIDGLNCCVDPVLLRSY